MKVFKTSLMSLILCGLLPILGCGEQQSAGAVIDTSTLETEIQGRKLLEITGKWFYQKDPSGRVDSVQVSPQGGLKLEFQEGQSLSYESDSLGYFAYRILAEDTIRPSASLKLLMPHYENWDSLNPPEFMHWPVRLLWNEVHQVWETSSIPPGRHLLRWKEKEEVLQTDLLINDKGAFFENHQGAGPLQRGSLRPVDCGFSTLLRGKDLSVGQACPHVESDAFNQKGTSEAVLLEWSPSNLAFYLHTSKKTVQTPNPYAKLLLEFSPEEKAFRLDTFSTVQFQMEIPLGSQMQIRIAQKSLAIGHWFYAEVEGRGKGVYTLHFPTDFKSDYSESLLNLDSIFGFEFRNAIEEQELTVKMDQILFE